MVLNGLHHDFLIDKPLKKTHQQESAATHPALETPRGSTSPREAKLHLQDL